MLVLSLGIMECSGCSLRMNSNHQIGTNVVLYPPPLSMSAWTVRFATLFHLLTHEFRRSQKGLWADIGKKKFPRVTGQMSHQSTRIKPASGRTLHISEGKPRFNHVVTSLSQSVSKQIPPRTPCSYYLPKILQQRHTRVATHSGKSRRLQKTLWISQSVSIRFP